MRLIDALHTLHRRADAVEGEALTARLDALAAIRVAIEAKGLAVAAATAALTQVRDAIEDADLPIATRVHAAVALQTPIAVLYTPLSRDESEVRRLSPYSVTAQRSGEVLLAWDHDRGDFRRFRVDHIDGVVIAETVVYREPA